LAIFRIASLGRTARERPLSDVSFGAVQHGGQYEFEWLGKAERECRIHRTRVRSTPRLAPLMSRRAPSAPPVTINHMSLVQRDYRTEETYQTFSNSPVGDHLASQYYLQQARQFLIQQSVTSGVESSHALPFSHGRPTTPGPPGSHCSRTVSNSLWMAGPATVVDTSPVPPVRRPLTTPPGCSASTARQHVCTVICRLTVAIMRTNSGGNGSGARSTAR
jgi:hypothetical protein